MIVIGWTVIVNNVNSDRVRIISKLQLFEILIFIKLHLLFTRHPCYLGNMGGLPN